MPCGPVPGRRSAVIMIAMPLLQPHRPESCCSPAADAQLIVDSYYLSRALFAKCKLISRGSVRACREKKEPERMREEDGERCSSGWSAVPGLSSNSLIKTQAFLSCPRCVGERPGIRGPDT